MQFEPFFGVPVTFNAQQDALVFERRILDLPLEGAFPALHEQARTVPPARAVEILDRVGGGDCLSGGYIAAKLGGKDDGYAIKFAVALSALQHSFPGDYSWATAAEAEKLMAGGETRINR